jgi:hypothetical protein
MTCIEAHWLSDPDGGAPSFHNRCDTAPASADGPRRSPQMWVRVDGGTEAVNAARLALGDRVAAAQQAREDPAMAPPEPRPARVRALRSYDDFPRGRVEEGQLYLSTHPSVLNAPEGFEAVAEDEAA